ncbi:MAG: DUF1489 domain-containing protein [Alphaproteobacteria bacterium]
MVMHMIKLSVGSDSPATLDEWQRSARLTEMEGQEASWHITRQMPRQRDEILNGGSIYWVIKGEIRCRQPVLGLDPIQDEEGTKYCKITLGRPLVLTVPVPRRPFQGWRYLKPGDEPPDLDGNGDSEMAAELRALGLL